MSKDNFFWDTQYISSDHVESRAVSSNTVFHGDEDGTEIFSKAGSKQAQAERDFKVWNDVLFLNRGAEARGKNNPKHKRKKMKKNKDRKRKRRGKKPKRKGGKGASISKE